MNSVRNLILVISFCLCFGTNSVAAVEDFKELSTDNMLYLKGVISKTYPNEMQISVKPPKGKLVRIIINSNTVLEGVTKVDDFKKEQQVKVWYSQGKGNNQAIKIKKMIRLGC